MLERPSLLPLSRLHCLVHVDDVEDLNFLRWSSLLALRLPGLLCTQRCASLLLVRQRGLNFSVLQAKREVKMVLVGLQQAFVEGSGVKELPGGRAWQIRVELDQDLFLLFLALLPVEHLRPVPRRVLSLDVGEERMQVLEVLELQLTERVVSLLEGVVERTSRTPPAPACCTTSQGLIDAFDLLVVLVVLDEALRGLQRCDMRHVRILNEAAIASLAELRLVPLILVLRGHFWRELIVLAQDVRSPWRVAQRLVGCNWR